MNGIICINKPQGYTSFDVVAVIRRLFKTRKVGHGGTLDPMATGVLPIFIGNATKAVDFCPDTDKQYLAGFKFGITTDTQDITGTVISENPVYVSRNKIALMERVSGEIEQLPPMYSAVKVGGTRLYEFARKGQTVERKARKVRIDSVKVEQYADNCGMMRVDCSRGTYIRTLIHDLGEEIGAGAVMTSLVRTKSSGFTLEDCYELEQLQELAINEGFDALEQKLIPLEQLFDCYPRANLDATQTRMFSYGAVLSADRIKFDRIYQGIYAVYNFNGHFVAIAKIEADHSLGVIQRFQPTDATFAKGVKKKLDD